MKIVIAAEIFPPDIGGPATYSKKLAEELAKRYWEVKLICYSDSSKVDSDPDYVTRVKRSKLKFLHYKKYYSTLKKLAKDCNVIYAMGPVGSGLPALKVSRALKKKLIVKVVGDYAWERASNLEITKLGIDEFQKETLSGRIGQLQKIEKQVCQQADKVIVPSQYLKKIVSGWGVSESHIEVVYNSVTKYEDIKKDIQIKRQNNLIVSIGRLVKWKGFETLILTMPELLKENPNFKLIIGGSGPEEKNLKVLIDKKNLNRCVEIRNMSSYEVFKYLRQAGVFVLNTAYEGLSHTILEAMGVYTPIITTNIGGNPELIEMGENGILIEYNNKNQLKDAILNLNKDSKLREKFVYNSEKVLKNFTFEKMMTKTIEVLKS
ncbi:glycosyltransferase family 4 protein [Patescibacteria group bacterium]|nr:glycosyltransferase family 4 protein [Patescibacteria group bacterium]